MHLNQIKSRADLKQFFLERDANHDKMLSMDELKTEDPAAVAALDENGDRFLSRGEIAASANLLSHGPQLVNLRAVRTPRSPFRVESPSLLATVSFRLLDSEDHWKRWGLTIQLESRVKPWRLISVSSPTPEVQIAPVAADTQGQRAARELSLEMETPVLCPVDRMDKLREAVILEVAFDVAGKTKRERIAVDYRCFVGSALERVTEQAFAGLAASYMADPLIEALVRRASGIPVGSPKEEAERLKQWIHFDSSKWMPDPSNFEPGWWGQMAYIQSPSELVWFGLGDCNDYGPMVAAFLALRGLHAGLAFTPGHMWAIATRPSGVDKTAIDFMPDAKAIEPTSVAPVVRPAPRPAGTPRMQDDIVHFVPDL